MATITAEAGLNHNSFLASALELCDIARHAGADVVKFQRRVPEISVPRTEWATPKSTPWGTIEPYLEYKKKIELSQEQYREISQHCKDIGIPWTASVWDLPSLDNMREFDVPFIKLPSAKLTNDELLLACADSGSPIVLSCGMSTEKEVDHAVSLIRDVPGASLLHCHSTYPSPGEEQNLSLIPKMRERYGLPVGYSSHSVSPFVPLAAVSRYGAVAIEVHITKHREAKGTDHAASLEPHGLELLVREINRLDALHGDGQRRLWTSEIPTRLKLRGV